VGAFAGGALGAACFTGADFAVDAFGAAGAGGVFTALTGAAFGAAAFGAAAFGAAAFGAGAFGGAFAAGRAAGDLLVWVFCPALFSGVRLILT
jgi:hypothetical protein